MFSSSIDKCGKVLTGFAFGSDLKQPAYLGDVVNKLKRIPEFQNLTREELLSKATELTDPEKIWSLYFSGVILDPAREHIEKVLEQDVELNGPGAGPSISDVQHAAKVPIKLRLRPIRASARYGIQNSFISLLFEHYGSVHASIIVQDMIVLEWNTSSLVIPTGKPIQPNLSQNPLLSKATNKTISLNQPASIPQGTNGTVSQDRPPFTVEDEIEYEFEASAAKKDHVDKLIKVIVKYNRNYGYHPIFRNCQKFVVDALKALDYPINPNLERHLGDYFNALEKKCKKLKFDSHSDLDVYVDKRLKSSTASFPEIEYLLSRYFLFHVTSMTESDNPERWVCPERGCCVTQLERRLDLENTIARQILCSQEQH